jgi:hypothetical protein
VEPGHARPVFWAADQARRLFVPLRAIHDERRLFVPLRAIHDERRLFVPWRAIHDERRLFVPWRAFSPTSITRKFTRTSYVATPR